MERKRTEIKQWLMTGGLVLLLLVSFPLLALAVFTARFVLLAGAVVTLLGGTGLYLASPAFRRWFKVQVEPEINCNGLRLATDVAVHPSHSWARIEPEAVIVGADDFVQASLGPVEAVDLPAQGCRVDQGDPLFSLRRGSRRVDVRAPVAGTVLSSNEALRTAPGLVNDQPFTSGWAVRLHCDSLREDRRGLLRGSKALAWLRQEIDRMIVTVLAEEAVSPALPDGGALVGELYEQIDEVAWQRLTTGFFDADRFEDADHAREQPFDS